MEAADSEEEETRSDIVENSVREEGEPRTPRRSTRGRSKGKGKGKAAGRGRASTDRGTVRGLGLG